MWDQIAPESHSLGTALLSLSRNDKKLIKLAFIGDSLTARPLGEAIPVGLDEGLYCRPPWFGTNSVARRAYDYIMDGWNKAIFRGCSHTDWSKTGTWSIVTDESVHEPPHADTPYHYSVDPLATKSFTITNENMGVIVHRSASFGTLDFTLNGGSISAYGPSSVSLTRAQTDPSDIGNPYYTVEFYGLPVGGTLTVSKRNDTTKVGIWGCFSWTGNTMVPYNIGHSGHNMSMLMGHGHLQSDYLENNMDAAIVQLPIMNECGSRTLAQAVADYTAALAGFFLGKDVLFYTPHPFGKDPAGTNYYTIYSNPSMANFIDAIKPILLSNGMPYQDVFNTFRKMIINRGGSLAGGEVSAWYLASATEDDGQHTYSSFGCGEVFRCLLPALVGKVKS